MLPEKFAASMTVIPIRMVAAICVQERLPPGAAGVLINQTHTHQDLTLPIHVDENRWLYTTDGI